jgi:FkbM family methyltransferase
LKALYNIIRFIFSHPLARRNKVKALKRFFLYQLGKIFIPYPILYPFTDKTKLIIEKGMTGATGNIYCGLHEFEDMSFLLHFLRPEDLFVDVGANVGSYTILASGHVGARTIAFEPIRNTYDRLNNNIAINHIEDKVMAYNMGIGARKDVLRFTANLDTVNHVVLEGEDEDFIEVKVDSLDEMLGKEFPSLMKIDVEGFETEVLAGASEVFNNQALKAIIIELNGSGTKYGYSEDAIHQLLIRKQFTSYQYDPFSRALTRTTTFGTANTIYIRDIDFVMSRIKTAEKVKVIDMTF